MPLPVKTVGTYLKELKETRKDKPPQVKEALDIYIELWESAIRGGKVGRDEEIGAAITKIETAGGLYQAAELGDTPA